MNLSEQLANRFREVIFHGTWVANTNFKDQLTDLSWQKATQQVNSFNTIAVLTFHINYYISGVLNVFNGKPLNIRDQYSFNAPPITSQKDWELLKSNLFTNATAFANHLDKLSDEQLLSVFVNEKYGTYLRNIEGMIEHCYYHLGQISLIKKELS